MHVSLVFLKVIWTTDCQFREQQNCNSPWASQTCSPPPNAPWGCRQICILPFPGQRLGLWPNSCHGRERLPGRRRDGKIQIQGACFPMQRLQPHGSLHFTLDRAWASPAVAGEGGELRSHCPLQGSFDGCLGIMCGGHGWWGAWLLLCWCSC